MVPTGSRGKGKQKRCGLAKNKQERKAITVAPADALQACTETRDNVSVGTMDGVPKSILCLKKVEHNESEIKQYPWCNAPLKAISQLICMVHTGMTSVLCEIISSGVLASIYSGLR